MAKQSFISSSAQYQGTLFPMSFNDLVPKDSRARLVDRVVENLDLSEIMATYKGGGTKAYHPKVLLKIIFLAYTDNVYSGREIERLCQENVLYMWLTGGHAPSYRTITRFRSGRVGDKVENLFKQFLQTLIEQGLLSIDIGYLDGTVIESKANRYSCVWGANLRRKEAKLHGEIKDIMTQIKDSIIEETSEMTRGEIDESKALAEEVEKKAQEATKKAEKKNSKVTLSDSASKEEKKAAKEAVSEATQKTEEPLEVGEEMIDKLEEYANSRPEKTSEEKAKKRELKSKVKALRKKSQELSENNQKLNTLGDGRNSFSKTDPSATAMRQKNTGATYTPILLPSYNVQAIANQGFLLGIRAFNAPTDSNLLPSMIDQFKETFGAYPSALCADAGYGSEENFSLLDSLGIKSFVKPKDYRKDTGQVKPKNTFDSSYWPHDKESDTIECPEGKVLSPTKVTYEPTDNKYIKETTQYTTSECTTCPNRNNCIKTNKQIVDPNSTKQVGRSKKLLQQKEEIYKNLNSEEGKEHLRRRAFEIETIFGQLKSNCGYHRFRHIGIDRINVDLIFLAISHNMKKLYRNIIKGGKDGLFRLLNTLFAPILGLISTLILTLRGFSAQIRIKLTYLPQTQKFTYFRKSSFLNLCPIPFCFW